MGTQAGFCHFIRVLAGALAVLLQKFLTWAGRVWESEVMPRLISGHGAHPEQVGLLAPLKTHVIKH